jgi:dienelactone hydrolase
MFESLLLGLTTILGQASGGVDWTAITQKPFDGKAAKVRRLPPLLDQPEQIKTIADWNKARDSIHSKWSDFLGAPPAKPASLEAKFDAVEKQQGWTRRHVSFNAEGGDRIQAYLLTPDPSRNSDRRPAAVVFHETTPNTCRQPAGVSGPSDRAFGVELVRLGYVVLCPECYILKPLPSVENAGPINWAKTRAAELKRRRPGWTGMGKLAYDAARCVDFLESLPEIDRSRIGCLGFSLGAKQVIYAMAFDSRYKAGVANEGGVGVDMSNWHDEWYLGPAIKQRTATMDHHQLLALAAPRALMIQGGGSADGRQSWPYVEAVLPIYALHGAKDRIGLFDHRGGHTFPSEGRRVAYQWLDHWLQNKPTSNAAK